MADASWPSDPVERALMEDDQRRSFVFGNTGRDPGEHPLAAEVRRLRAEHAAALAAARMDERQRAAEVCLAGALAIAVSHDMDLMPAFEAHRHDATTILAQPAPDGADALAAMLAEAERRGIERAAAKFDNYYDDGRRIIVGKVNLSCAEARHVAAAIRALLEAKRDAALAQEPPA